MQGEWKKESVTVLTRVLQEVRLLIFGVVWIVPEVSGHAGERLGADEFSALPVDALACPEERTRSSIGPIMIPENPEWFTFFIPALQSNAQQRTLNFSTVHGKGAIVAHKAGDDVRASRDGTQDEISLDVLVDVVEAGRFQRRPRGQDSS